MTYKILTSDQLLEIEDLLNNGWKIARTDTLKLPNGDIVIYFLVNEVHSEVGPRLAKSVLVESIVDKAQRDIDKEVEFRSGNNKNKNIIKDNEKEETLQNP